MGADPTLSGSQPERQNRYLTVTIGGHHVDGLLIFQHLPVYPLRDPATDFTSLLFRVLEDQALSNTLLHLQLY